MILTRKVNSKDHIRIIIYEAKATSRWTSIILMSRAVLMILGLNYLVIKWFYLVGNCTTTCKYHGSWPFDKPTPHDCSLGNERSQQKVHTPEAALKKKWNLNNFGQTYYKLGRFYSMSFISKKNTFKNKVSASSRKCKYIIRESIRNFRLV